MPDLTHEDVKKILKIIDDMGDRDVRIEVGDLKIHVTRAGADPMVGAIPATAPAATRAAPSAAKGPHAAVFDAPPGRMAIRAPTFGAFYRAASPGARPYVEVGDRVGPDDTVCMFEVMKLFTSIKAEVAGRIAAILVENEAQVEQDQILMLIEPE